MEVTHQVRESPQVRLWQTQHQLSHLAGSKCVGSLYYQNGAHLAQPLKGRKPCREEEVGVEMSWKGFEDEVSKESTLISILAASHVTGVIVSPGRSEAGSSRK